MVARHNILAFGAARKACMRPKEALYQLSNYWWLSRLALHCRLHRASVHQKLRTRLDLPPCCAYQNELVLVGRGRSSSGMKNDEGDGIATTAEAALSWRISHHQKAHSGHAGAPHAPFQHSDSALSSLAASLGYAQMAHPAHRGNTLENASAAATVSISHPKRPPATFANAAYTALCLTYGPAVRPDIHLQSASSTVSSGFCRS